MDSVEAMGIWGDRRIEWIRDPVVFAREFLGIGLCHCGRGGEACDFDDVQKRILRRFAYLVKVKHKIDLGIYLDEEEKKWENSKGMSVQSGKGVGKTFLAAIIGLWFLVCFENSRVVVLGPKYEQIKTRLWAEISKWMGHAEKVFGEDCFMNSLLEKRSDKIFCKHVSKSELGEKWVMFIQTFPKNADIEQQKVEVQGNHDRFMLFLIDEAIGVPNHICEASEETCTDPVNLLFVIFNPNRTNGWAIDTQEKMKDQYMTERINAENSTRVSDQHIKFMRDKYGVDSNKYRVGVLGLAPLADADGAFPWSWIQAAKDRWELMEPDESDQLIHGNDVGAGGDQSMICKRKGMKVLEFKGKGDPDTGKIRDWMIEEATDDMPYGVAVDMNGVGNTTYHDMSRTKLWKVKGVYAQGTSRRKDCDSLRDDLLMCLRDAFEKNEIAIPPDDDELEGELSIIKVDDSTGVNKFTSKKDSLFKKEMLSRVGYKSPNKVDSLALTFIFNYNLLRTIDKKIRSNTGFPKDRNKELSRHGWMAI